MRYYQIWPKFTLFLKAAAKTIIKPKFSKIAAKTRGRVIRLKANHAKLNLINPAKFKPNQPPNLNLRQNNEKTRFSKTRRVSWGEAIKLSAKILKENFDKYDSEAIYG